MNRRGFLKLFAGAAAAAVVAEAVPTYFLPPIGGWKSDVIVNPTSYRTYLMGADALVNVDLLKVYYDKSFIANLKARSPIALPAIALPAIDNRRRDFSYMELD